MCTIVSFLDIKTISFEWNNQLELKLSIIDKEPDSHTYYF